MPGSLTRLFLRVLADKAHLGILVFEVSPDLNEIKVIRDEQNSVPRAVFVNSIPDLLGEEIESGLVSMFKGGNIWKPP